MSSRSRERKTRAGDLKVGTRYYIDFSKCSLCGLCVDVCPEYTLQFSKEYEYVFYSRWDTVIDIKGRLEGKTMNTIADFIPPILVAQTVFWLMVVLLPWPGPSWP